MIDADLILLTLINSRSKMENLIYQGRREENQENVCDKKNFCAALSKYDGNTLYCHYWLYQFYAI